MQVNNFAYFLLFLWLEMLIDSFHSDDHVTYPSYHNVK